MILRIIVIVVSFEDMSKWSGLFVPDVVLKNLAELGFSAPTLVQERCLPVAIKGNVDIIAAAETVRHCCLWSAVTGVKNDHSWGHSYKNLGQFYIFGVLKRIWSFFAFITVKHSSGGFEPIKLLTNFFVFYYFKINGFIFEGLNWETTLNTPMVKTLSKSDLY